MKTSVISPTLTSAQREAQWQRVLVEEMAAKEQALQRVRELTDELAALKAKASA